MVRQVVHNLLEEMVDLVVVVENKIQVDQVILLQYLPHKETQVEILLIFLEEVVVEQEDQEVILQVHKVQVQEVLEFQVQ